MHALPTGFVTDTAIKAAFNTNGTGRENWIESVIKAYNNAADIATIFHNTRGEETACILTFYSENLYPASAPCLNINIVTRSASTITDFNAVSTNLGIPPVPREELSMWENRQDITWENVENHGNLF